jgi:head-tail adaptor
MGKEKYGIRDFKHRITLCSASDVVTEGGTMVLSRVAAWDAWAHIEESRGSFFSRDGYAVKEQRDQRSHKICIRYRTDKEISGAAWIYEQRAKSSPRWFKVLSVCDKGEMGRFWQLECRLVERSDDVVKPVEAKPDDVTLQGMALPEGVTL